MPSQRIVGGGGDAAGQAVQIEGVAGGAPPEDPPAELPPVDVLLLDGPLDDELPVAVPVGPVGVPLDEPPVVLLLVEVLLPPVERPMEV